MQITDGALTYRDDRTEKMTTLNVKRLATSAASSELPTHIDLDAAFNGTGFNLKGVIGPLTRLQNPAATSPWPVNVTLAAAGASIGVNGTRRIRCKAAATR